MKTALIGLGIAMAVAAGCAHGPVAVAATVAAGRDVRGAARVGQQAQALVAGPARMVHATGEKPVRWFVAEKKTGGDADCAAGSGGAVESTRTELAVGAGQVLCAAVTAGATDVSWHQFTGSPDALWALR
jgi:hypothetical protein